MEYVLLSLIVLFIGGLFGFAILIWRETQIEKKFGQIHKDLTEFRRLIDSDFIKVTEQLNSYQEFIRKAHTDLNTIVQEYEINGVPLGYDRGKKADFVEGL